MSNILFSIVIGLPIVIIMRFLLEIRKTKNE